MYREIHNDCLEQVRKKCRFGSCYRTSDCARGDVIAPVGFGVFRFPFVEGGWPQGLKYG